MAELSQMEWVRRNWVHVLVLGSTVAVATFGLVQVFLLGPARDEVAELKATVDRLQADAAARPSTPSPPPPDDPVALEPTGVSERASVTTRDGRCNIFVKSVIGSIVALAVTVDAREPEQHDVLEVGKRVTIDAGNKLYFIDIHRTRGSIVDLSVQQQRK